MDDKQIKSDKLRTALLKKSRGGVRFMKENEQIIIDQLNEGFSAIAIYNAFIDIDDEPPITQRTFEYHVKKIKDNLSNYQKPKSQKDTIPTKKETKKTLNWNATHTGKDIK